MKTLTLKIDLPYSVEVVWNIISDVTRCDWVPSVESISLDDNVRSFSMEGIGEVQEKILLKDPETHTLQYTAIKTPSPLEHHLATIELETSAEGCLLQWTSEIAPEQFGDAIEHGMQISLDGLKRVLSNSEK